VVIRNLEFRGEKGRIEGLHSRLDGREPKVTFPAEGWGFSAGKKEFSLFGLGNVPKRRLFSAPNSYNDDEKGPLGSLGGEKNKGNIASAIRKQNLGGRREGDQKKRGKGGHPSSSRFSAHQEALACDRLIQLHYYKRPSTIYAPTERNYFTS